MKKCIVFILCLLLNTDGFSQYNSKNLKKYWFYRKRFIDYFTVVGNGAGESNVADRRNGKNAGDSSSGSQLLIHGDQTTNLGDYIAMLATEYKLLNDNGQYVCQTTMKFCNAHKIFNKVDNII